MRAAAPRSAGGQNANEVREKTQKPGPKTVAISGPFSGPKNGTAFRSPYKKYIRGAGKRSHFWDRKTVPILGPFLDRIFWFLRCHLWSPRRANGAAIHGRESRGKPFPDPRLWCPTHSESRRRLPILGPPGGPKRRTAFAHFGQAARGTFSFQTLRNRRF